MPTSVSEQAPYTEGQNPSVAATAEPAELETGDPAVLEKLKQVFRPQEGRKAKAETIMNEDLFGIYTHCLVCTRPIPEDMAKRKAVTDTEACRDVLLRLRRKHKDDKQCRYCKKPSTPSQRRRFGRFQKWEMEFPELAYREVLDAVQPIDEGITREVFAAAVSEARDQDYSLELNPLADRWTRFPKPNKPHANLDRVIEALHDYWGDKA